MSTFWEWFIWQGTWVIVLSIGAIPILTGIAVYCLALSGPVTRLVRPAELAPPYIGAVTLLFALFASLMMGDIWHRESHIGHLVQEEASRLRSIVDLSELCGPPCAGVRDATQNYARTLAAGEWRREWVKLSPDADTALSQVLVALGAMGRSPAVEASTQASFMTTYSVLRRLRSERYGILYFDMAPHRWAMIIVLGVLTQLVLASLHVGRRNALVIVLTLFTLAFVATLAYMAALVWPAADQSVISPEDMRRLLAP